MQKYKIFNGHKNTNMFVCDDQNDDTISDYELIVRTYK